MLQQKLYKGLSVLLSVLLCAVCLLPALQTGVDAATYTQGFENNFNNCGAGFSVYTGSEGDKFVHSGTHSLKFAKAAGTKVTSLYQQGLQLEPGKDYIITLWVYVATAKAGDYAAFQVQTLRETTNGWSFDSAYRSQEYGFGSDKGNTWQQVRMVLNAKYQYLGLSLWGMGEPDVYFDDLKVEEAPVPVTVTFNTNGGSAVQAISGVPGNTLTLPAAPTKEGYTFGGWYTDSVCSTPFTATVFPDAATTLYAKWNKAGSFKQDFENYDLTLEKNSGFSIYSGKAGDANVTGGTHSLFKDGSVTSATKVLTLSDPYTELTVGKGYRFSAKLKVTNVGSGTGLSFTQLRERKNAWSFAAQESIAYIGSDYKHVNEFTEIEYYFIASQKYFGLTSWGTATYYMDDVEVTEVPMVTVSFVTPGVEAPQAVTGPAGMKLTVKNPTPPAGKSFAGWYEDAAYQNAVSIAVFPQADTTYYAKWIDEGCFEQSFESFNGAGHQMSETFSIYKATSKDDPNVYDGKCSIKYDSNTSGTYAISLFDGTMGQLKIGEKYYVTVHFKPVRTPEGKWGSSGSYHSIYYTNQWDNAWNYRGQGPIGRYLPYAFYENNIGEKWSGTVGAVTSTTEKDANGWLTMTYEITAVTNYIALYFAGDFAMYMDAVTITPLPNGLIERNYENAYCEAFYNQLTDTDLSGSAAGKKSVYKLEVGSRADLVFAAEPKNGAKAYLAYDEAGNNTVEGTEFAQSGVHSASRIMADFSGVLYLVVEGNAKTDFNFLALYNRSFGLAEDPTPEARPDADYEHLTVKNAVTDLPGADTRFEDEIPATGDVALPVLAIVFSVLAAGAVLALRKGRKA